MYRLPLVAFRSRIENLASDGGEYCVICGRTGERPVPVAGRSFPDRETASTAAKIASAYRAVLSAYDPRAPVYDFIVCETGGRGASSARPRERPGGPTLGQGST